MSSFPPPADTLTYETFFGLTEKPFSLSSDPRFLYHSAPHAATFEDLLGGIRRREGLLVLTGEIGTGKTTLCRAVLQSLGRQTFSAFVPDPFASREDLLKMMLIDFGVTSIQDFISGTLKQASRTELSYLLAGFLESIAPLDAFAVVVVDEAQNMSLSMIEETRILADSFGGRGHLQIVFVGQPELHAKLKLPEMRQVDQRICGYTHLAPLSQDAVGGYIQHRLHVAGGSRERIIFPAEVVDLVHQRSGGVPRLINRICDRALHLAYARQATLVDSDILEGALCDIGATTLSPTWESIVHRGPAAQTAQTTMEPPTPAPIADLPASLGVGADLSDETALTSHQAPAFARQIVEWSPIPDPTGKRQQPSLDDFATDSRESTGQAEAYWWWLGRAWTKRAAIAAATVVALNAVALSASHLSFALAESPELPALPASALAVPDVAPPTFPPLQPSASIAAGEFFVAVGLFASGERADRLVHTLAGTGLRVSRRPYQLRNRMVQQVVLGPFGQRGDALAHLQQLRQLGGYHDAHVIDGATVNATQ